MKIKSNVKAGGIKGANHNEKLASDKKTKNLTVKVDIKAGSIVPNHNEKLSDDGKVIEQQKSFGKKLRLNKETIRNLKEGDILKGFELMRVVGGAAISRRPDCYTTCIIPYTY